MLWTNKALMYILQKAVYNFLNIVLVIINNYKNAGYA